jgi:ribonuclease P protein component
VFRDGVRADGRLLSLVAAHGLTARARLGLAASRRLGGAVARNRAKRLVRESFRREPRDGALDVVVLPKAGILEAGQGAVAAEFGRLLGRVHRRLESQRREVAPAVAH